MHAYARSCMLLCAGGKRSRGLGRAFLLEAPVFNRCSCCAAEYARARCKASDASTLRISAAVAWKIDSSCCFSASSTASCLFISCRHEARLARTGAR